MVANRVPAAPSPESPLQGGCLCGAVRFEITAPHRQPPCSGDCGEGAAGTRFATIAHHPMHGAARQRGERELFAAPVSHGHTKLWAAGMDAVEEVAQMIQRTLVAVAAAAALAITAPGLAVAAHRAAHRSSTCHHRSHHACARSRHAARARHITFGAPTDSIGAGTAPSTPITPAPAEPAAGKVASFTGGVLTITLTDGSSVSGKVTEATEITCATAAQPGGDDQNEEAGGPESDSQESNGQASGGADGGGASSGALGVASHGDAMSSGGDTEGTQGDDEEGSAGAPSACTSAALIPGAVVADAELSIGGAAGAVWDHVDLAA